MGILGPPAACCEPVNSAGVCVVPYFSLMAMISGITPVPCQPAMDGAGCLRWSNSSRQPTHKNDYWRSKPEIQFRQFQSKQHQWPQQQQQQGLLHDSSQKQLQFQQF